MQSHSFFAYNNGFYYDRFAISSPPPPLPFLYLLPLYSLSLAISPSPSISLSPSPPLLLSPSPPLPLSPSPSLSLSPLLLSGTAKLLTNPYQLCRGFISSVGSDSLHIGKADSTIFEHARLSTLVPQIFYSISFNRDISEIYTCIINKTVTEYRTWWK